MPDVAGGPELNPAGSRSSDQSFTPQRINHGHDQLTYEMLTARFLAHDELLWQTPVLALTAQSFLMTISLSRDVANLAAATSAGLAAVLILMSMHLLGRHRFLELIEKHKLMELEKSMGIEPLSTHSWAWKYEEAPRLGRAYRPGDYGLESPRYPRVFSWPSYFIWQIGLTLFAVANIGICIYRLWAIGSN